MQESEKRYTIGWGAIIMAIAFTVLLWYYEYEFMVIIGFLVLSIGLIMVLISQIKPIEMTNLKFGAVLSLLGALALFSSKDGDYIVPGIALIILVFGIVIVVMGLNKR